MNNIKNGIVCFTFDDRNFKNWLDAMPLFEKYGAHASFFISGEIDEEALECMNVLAKRGHTVGLHTLNHAVATEYFENNRADEYMEKEVESQLKVCRGAGLNIKSFSYPNNRRNEETDEALLKYFSRFRAGIGNAESEEIYVEPGRLADHRVMHGFGIGEYYNTVEEELIGKIIEAAQRNVCITFFSHGIEENAKHIHMPTALLERCLETAEREGVRVLGFDELPEKC